MSSAVVRAIGADNAMTFDISNVCAGMLTGVTVLNDWIRQGIVQRGLVVSGEYMSQLGQNAARHVRNIMSKELACLTLPPKGPALGLFRHRPDRRRSRHEFTDHVANQHRDPDDESGARHHHEHRSGHSHR